MSAADELGAFELTPAGPVRISAEELVRRFPGAEPTPEQLEQRYQLTPRGQLARLAYRLELERGPRP